MRMELYAENEASMRVLGKNGLVTEVYGYAFSVLSPLWEESGIKRDRRRGAHTVLRTV